MLLVSITHGHRENFSGGILAQKKGGLPAHSSLLTAQSFAAEKKREERTVRNRSGSGQFGDGGKQFAGVVLLRIAEDFLRGADFDELAGAHRGDARGQLSHDRQAVGYENVGERE